MTISGERAWQKLVRNVLQRPDLLDMPDFSGNLARLANRDVLHVTLNSIFAAAPQQHWMQRMRAAGVPAGVVRSISESVSSEEVKARQLIGSAPHARLGSVANLRNPIKLSATPVREPVGAPVLGQHTHSVLCEVLGMSETAIANLAATGAIPVDG
jgi:formyl-CoA transferase